MTFNADAHGHIITQRAPSDDEQTASASRRLLNAEFILDHACARYIKQRNAKDRRRMALMLYAIPDLELEAEKEARAQVKGQMKGFFDGMAHDFAGPFTGNKLRQQP